MQKKASHEKLQAQVLDKSIEAFILAIETINRLSIKYRIETFCYLICNAWELLLKAKILNDTKKRTTIYYKKRQNRPRRTLSLRDSLKKVFQNQNDPFRRNIEVIASVRDRSTHLIITQVPADVWGIFQACVINYHTKLQEWFRKSLSDKDPLGMMALVYDLDPKKCDLSDARIIKTFTKDTLKYLLALQRQLAIEYEKLDGAPEFSIGITYKLALVKDTGKADITLSTGDSSERLKIVEVPKDPSRTHPYRQTDVIQKLNEKLSGKVINAYDIQCILKVYNIKSKSEFFYQSPVKGSPGTYSKQFVSKIIEHYKKDPDFFTRIRAKSKANEKGKRF